jgi:plastocyanin
VVGESGFGVRLLALPLPTHMKHEGMGSSTHHDLEAIGSLLLEREVVAIAASGSRIWAVLHGGELATIDAADAGAPRLVSVVPLPAPVAAAPLLDIAASGSKLFAVGPHGTTVLEPLGTALAFDGPYPEIGGYAITVDGRMVHVALGAGVRSFRDSSTAAVTHDVTIGNFFFSPQHLTIDSGDTVRWSWAGHAAIPHNVDSCDGSPPAGAAAFCGSQPVAVEGTFTSGAASTSPFVFDRTFSAIGLNPYFCIAHVSGGMTGSITVEAAPPPGVPAGSPGSPLVVDKLTADGASLRLVWDASTCDPAAHLVVAGFGADLPNAPGGPFTLPGGVAQCGPSAPPFDWPGVPDPSTDPRRLLWFLVVARSGSTEGSWGHDGDGAERIGPAAGGASGQCGVTAKDTSNLCGQ